MELWDVYDINRSKTDRTWVRGKGLEPGDFHLVIHVCIFNSSGEMLIQQRQSFKEGWSNLWDLTAGGSAIAGDTSQMAAQRELEEEIGLKVDFQHIRPHLTINFENGFDDIYLIQKDVQLHMLTLQYEEVQNVKWASKEEILTMIKNGEFLPYYESLIHLLFDSRNKRGTLSNN
ncbi:NUDIX domain-containing protein [Bacillus luteolus]|uniref:NUDIX domain-containing protein n=1 Tax=Litchfieldia luteola TaxID=682179 RepID=A0ABR9QL36_9BACI|nr:NUDIX domain-containing protein [Cytobacillus luteolus]MBE4909208.1 NUDIX domain-containing protein [Cytobacillus luteolus]MBP1940337.1 isopentenyldiphosphate isomerase [Cytobacillus luteolus]